MRNNQSKFLREEKADEEDKRNGNQFYVRLVDQTVFMKYIWHQILCQLNYIYILNVMYLALI